MSEQYPDYATYQALYQKYVPTKTDRATVQILKYLHPIRGMRFLDLCGGAGTLSLEAVERQASTVLYVDASPVMVSPEARATRLVRKRSMPIREALIDIGVSGELFDRVACRQAINYWLTAETAELLASVMPLGGVFAFNTFNTKPPEEPQVRQYLLDGYAFTEVSWRVGSRVHHLQYREGMLPHHTSFAWIAPEQFKMLLRPHFRVQSLAVGTSTTYRCTR